MILYKLKKKKTLWFKSKKDVLNFLNTEPGYRKGELTKVEVTTISKDLLLSVLNNVPFGRSTVIDFKELKY